MKSFYGSLAERDCGAAGTAPDRAIPSRARVAVYEGPAAAPRVIDIEPAPVPDYIESLASTVYRLAKEQGGDIPYSVVREVSENLIHAHFTEPVISVLDGGRTIRFADRGPGFTDKDRAVRPGFTTATGAMKRYIRGVGSGLPLVRDYLGFSGGALIVEDNLGSGAVVTVRTGRPNPHDRVVHFSRSADSGSARHVVSSARQNPDTDQLFAEDTPSRAIPVLTTRQKQVLAIVMESGSAGPSLVARELGVGVSTAYRDLASLEEAGLIEAHGGQRMLAAAGLSYLNDLTSGG